MKNSHSAKIYAKKSARAHRANTISGSAYNLIIGLTLLYGFVSNVLMVMYARPYFEDLPIIGLLIGYVICIVLGAIIANVSSVPIISFFGYNLIVLPVGVLLSLVLPAYSTDLILLAVVLTAAVTVLMIVLSVIFPKFFSKLGLSLFWGLLIALIVEGVAYHWLGVTGNIFVWIFIGIFSLYIGYDWNKAQSYAKTVDNAVDSAIDLYLDIINLFAHILDLLDD